MRKRTAILATTLLAASTVLAAPACPARAQPYPTRPITIVVPFAAGGGNDILARLLGQHMGRALGQQFVIENRAGAGTNIATEAVVNAPPEVWGMPSTGPGMV